MRYSKGFNLIELMVVVFIVSVLTAIALPAYKNYMMRGRIPGATSILASKRVQMEQYFQDNRTYVAAPACNADTSSSQYFTFSCTGGGTPTATSYIITATGNNPGPMAGFTYTIDQGNNKQTTAAPAGWAAAAMPISCWITNTGGAC